MDFAEGAGGCQSAGTALFERRYALVDFKKRLAGKKTPKPTDPVELYDTLDRAHDKGPLRLAQEAVLEEWFSNHQSTRDVIVKLHTGQGKTLIGTPNAAVALECGKGTGGLSVRRPFLD